MCKRVGTVYLLHFTSRYQHAGHYIGWTGNGVPERVSEHVRGEGSPLIAAVVASGSGVLLSRTWTGVDRKFERRLKNRKEAPRLCPICKECEHAIQ